MAGADSFGSATFSGKIRSYARRAEQLPRLDVGVGFESLAEADAFFALVTPHDCYSLRSTLDGTPVLQTWGGGGIQTLTIRGLLTDGADALLVDASQDLWLPGGRTHGRATFYLTAAAAIP